MHPAIQVFRLPEGCHLLIQIKAFQGETVPYQSKPCG
jgi:hypothetical protein